MLSNQEVFVEHFRALASEPATRTAYGIKNTLPGDLWLAENGKWVAREHAKRFHSMTAANGHAVVEMGLALSEYSAEAL